MIWSETGTTQPRDLNNVFPGLLLGIYKPTSTGPRDQVTVTTVDATSSGGAIGKQGADLRLLYDKTGLTWKEIAFLFGVSERAVHAWIRAEKNMLPEKVDFLFGLTELVLALDRGRPYKTRQFLREVLLNNSTLIELLRKQDFTSLLVWAAKQPKASGWSHPPVSELVLRDNLSPDLTSMLAGGETKVQIKRGATKGIQVGRVRKRS